MSDLKKLSTPYFMADMYAWEDDLEEVICD